MYGQHDWTPNEADKAFEHTSKLAQYAVRKLGLRLPVGKEKRAGWSGALPFYLFWCGECDNAAKDYPHGFAGNRYLICSRCNARHDFNPWLEGFAMAWQHLRTRFQKNPDGPQ